MVDQVNLLKEIFNKINLLEDLEVYAHGSFLTSREPSDLDLVIVYDKLLNTRDSVVTFKESYTNKLRDVFFLKTDVILMSKNEAYEEGFLSFFPRLVRIV